MTLSTPLSSIVASCFAFYTPLIIIYTNYFTCCFVYYLSLLPIEKLQERGLISFSRTLSLAPNIQEASVSVSCYFYSFITAKVAVPVD